MLQGDAYVAAVLRPWVERVLDMVRPVPGDVVVDLGCGDGALTCALARRGARVVAVDDDAAALRATAEAAAAWRVGDLAVPVRAAAEALPLSDRCADVVVSLAGVDATPLTAVLHEAVRIGCDGGRTALLLWTEAAQHEGALREALAEQLGCVPAIVRQLAVSDDTVRSAVAIAHGFTVSLERDVACFQGDGHYWETMVMMRPLIRALIAGLPEGLQAQIRAGCARQLEKFAGHDGSLRIPVEGAVLSR